MFSDETVPSQAASRMREELVVIPLLIAALQLSIILLSLPARAQQADTSFYARPGVTPAEVIRARGFLAEEHFITTQDGYVLKLTRGRHPKINAGHGGLPNRAPILFVHGILEDPVVFLINSFDARPKDFSDHNLRAKAGRLVHEPSAKSLPFLAMNFGHEVWLLSRRGMPGSQKKVGNRNSIEPETDQDPTTVKSNNNLTGIDFASPSALVQLANFSNSNREKFSLQTFTTSMEAFAKYRYQLPEKARLSFDRNFWNYSLDEQAWYDLPQSIKYVLKQTGREKLSIVGHSAGGAITLMSLSHYPELADKISSAVLWSHGFSIGKGDLFNKIVGAEPYLDAYMGPIPPPFSVIQLQAFFGLLCSTSFTQRSLCAWLADMFLGPSGGREPVYPEYMSSVLFPTCSLEVAQGLQCVRYGDNMHMYDYGPAGNRAAYGKPIPPTYDASKIRLKSMSIYAAEADELVSPEDVSFVLPSLTVPYKYKVIEGTFNHQGYFFHDDTAHLVIIPSLIDIHSSD